MGEGIQEMVALRLGPKKRVEFKQLEINRNGIINKKDNMI